MTYSLLSFSRLGLRALSLLMLLMSSSLLAQNGAVTVTQSFSYTGQIVTWTVPAGVTSLTIEARGAEGAAGSYSVSGGKGAVVAAQVSVTPSQALSILVGQQPAYRFNYGGTGGGGTFVVAPPSSTTAPTPLVIAGGGGAYPDNPIKHGQATQQGSAGDGGGGGGSNGSGGARNTGGSGGGGLLSDGASVAGLAAGGKAFVHGGVIGGVGAPGGGYGGGGGWRWLLGW